MGRVKSIFLFLLIMNRIEREKHTVALMIKLYCRHKEGNDQPCDQCWELIDYATSRLDHCHFGNNKPTCQRCPIHCYKPQMKVRIKEVMRWAGPRMIFYHPVMALRHLIGR